MSGSFSYICQGNVKDSSKNWRIVEKKACRGELTGNFPKNCVNRLFIITHLVHCANYFILFIADC